MERCKIYTCNHSSGRRHHKSVLESCIQYTVTGIESTPFTTAKHPKLSAEAEMSSISGTEPAYSQGLIPYDPLFISAGLPSRKLGIVLLTSSNCLPGAISRACATGIFRAVGTAEHYSSGKNNTATIEIAKTFNATSEFIVMCRVVQNNFPRSPSFHIEIDKLSDDNSCFFIESPS